MVKNNSYIESLIQKFKMIFLGKRLDCLYKVFDEDDYEIDNVLFFDTNLSHIGVFIDGVNPFFTDKHICDFDSFNLFATYSEISLKKDIKFSSKLIDSLTITISNKYNEMFGFYLQDLKGEIVAFIFQNSAILVFYIKSKSEYFFLLNSYLKHLHQDDFIHIDINYKESKNSGMR